MKGLLLAIDIGNTTTECGIFKGTQAITVWRLSSTVDRTPDECWQTVSFFCSEAGIDPTKLTNLGIASVVPAQSRSFVNMGKERINKIARIIKSELDIHPSYRIKKESMPLIIKNNQKSSPIFHSTS